MPKVAYVGTFDPVHNGHVDIATRAAAAFDEVIIGVYKSPPTKTLMFGTDERVELFAESVRDVPNISVVPFTGLALMWRHIAPDIDVICILSSLEFQFVYSSRIKEVASLGSDVSALIPTHVNQALTAKLAK